MKPYYEHGGITIYCGDCKEVVPSLTYHSICTDPPWGTDTAVDSGRFTHRPSKWWRNTDRTKTLNHKRIAGDTDTFNPAYWITTPAILWGAQHYASALPLSGGWLIWDKRVGVEQLAEKGWPLGEAELAWTNVLGATRVFRNLWSGLCRREERGEFYHPTQKPVSLMRWCLAFLPEGVTLDPYMGSGSMLRAAKDLGRKAIGIEIEEKYCEIAAERLSQEVLNL